MTLEALVYGGVAGMRVLVIVAAFALYSAAVDPDEVLRLFRRLSFRSALTASLATRLVPVLGRDARNLARAYTLRASAAPGGGWLGRLRRASVLTRALAAGALERAVDVAAALEVRGFAAPRRGRVAFGSGAPWSRHDFAFAGGALALAVLCGAGAFAHLDSFTPYPELRLDLAPLDVALALSLPLVALGPWLVPRRWKRRRSRRRALPQLAMRLSWHGARAPRLRSRSVPEPLLRLDGLSYRYAGAARAALADVDLEVHEGELVLLAGSSGSGKSTLLRAAAGLVPHFFGGSLSGSVRVGGLDTRARGPAEIARVAASVFQEPESQVVMNTVRAELELPLESAGRSRRGDRARDRGDRALARNRRAAGALGRDALGWRASARRARCGARDRATPAAPGRADLAAGPGGRRRAGLAAAPPERGVGDDGAARGASSRALPRGRRPGRRSGRWSRRV